jgi:hypothetical protein
MAVEPQKTRCVATWWKDDPDADVRDRTYIPDTEEIEIEVRYEEDTFYIDGLRDGHWLTIPLHAVAKSIADGTVPPKDPAG